MKSYEYLPVTSLLFILACIAARTGAQKRLNPIILVPGDGGSQLEAKLNKTTSVAWYCWKTTNYFFPLWLNFELLVPKALNCLVDNMRLVYDKKTRTTSNSPGVQIRVPGFGETSTVEWVDPSEYKITSVFHEIVETLVSLGYKRNLSIRGAPYDFRKAPNELGDYMKSLKQLIEHTYYENSNKSVILMAHSMGNAVVLHLLNHMQKAWKAKFIRSHVSLAGVWGGAVKSVRLMISGDSLQVPLVSPEDVRRQQQSMPSTAWLMPSDEFWHKNEVIVVSPGRNYTIKDLKQLFIDINYTTGYMMWQDTNKLIKPLKAPGVELYCLHGNHVPTPVQLVYTNETWLKGFPKSVNEDGDGTVNLRSLQGCLRFRKQQKQPVKYKMFGWVEHTQILRNTDVLEYIKGVVAEINNKEDKAVKNGLYQN